MTSILWVEDQLHWINKFSHILENADFNGEFETASHSNAGNQVLIFRFAEAACQHIKQSKTAPDIAILDANMNGNDEAGFSVSRALMKKWPLTPIIYLSEHSGTEIEQQALELSETKDFIAKHQSNIESILCWRIKAALRKKAIETHSINLEQNELITSGELLIDLRTWEVYWHGQRLMNPNNSKRPLAPTPRKILRLLVEHSPRPLNTQQVAERLDLEKLNYASYRQHIKTLRHSFNQISVQDKQIGFIEACKAGQGIVTFGDEGAYCWKPIEPNK